MSLCFQLIVGTLLPYDNTAQKMIASFTLVGIVCMVLHLCVPVADSATCDICLCNNDTLDCSGKKLRYIPINPSPSTKVLNMFNNSLGEINDTALDGYENLEVLDLSKTHLSNISANAFQNTKNLIHLNLSYNEEMPLTDVTTSLDLFKPLQNLQELRMYGTTGSYNTDGYPDAALKQMPNLRSLWIDGFTNQSFGPAFAEMENLKDIKIPGDIIQPPWRFCDTSIHNGMLDYLVHVTNFTMRKCGIRSVGTHAFDYMKSLVYLDLSYNNLMTMAGISQAFISLSYTKLEVLVLNSIQNVDSTRCGVTMNKTMAEDLNKITTLKEVHIEYNGLNAFEKYAVQKLPKSIEYIYARKNEFQIGFYAFEAHYSLVNLRYADFSFNFLSGETAIWHKNPQSVSSTMESKCTRDVKLNQKFVEGSSNFAADEEHEPFPFDYIQTLRLPNSKSDFAQFFPKSLITQSDRSISLMQDNGSNISSVCPRALGLIPPGTIIFFIPWKLEYLDISHSMYGHPIPFLEVDGNNSLKILNASHSLLYCWDGPVKGLNKLEYLDLSLNMCTNVRLSFFDGVPALRYLSIASNFLQNSIKNDHDCRLFRNLRKLKELDISFNTLAEIPKRFFINQRNLEVLNLSYNTMTNFSVQLGHMENLKILDLSYNHISTLPLEIQDTLVLISEKRFKNTRKTFDLNLTGNPLQCYCQNRQFLQWVYEHMDTCRFLNVIVTECQLYNGTYHMIRNRDDLEKILYHLDSYCETYTNLIIAVAVTLCLVFNVIVGIIVHRFRWKIRYWYYVASKRHTKSRRGYINIDCLSPGSRFKYDVYVVSGENERVFVFGDTDVKGLKSHLEDANFKLFVQDDDVLPGQNLYSVIANAVNISRIVIFVISKHSGTEKEWKIAFRMSQEESTKRNQHCYLGIFLDYGADTSFSAEIREIRRLSYLDYPGHWQPANEETFWKELVEKISDTAKGINEMWTSSRCSSLTKTNRELLKINNP